MANKMIISAISAILLAGVANVASAEPNTPSPTPPSAHNIALPAGMEKCYGVSKAGYNDCGTAKNNCAGEAKVDRDKTAWLTVPAGLCKRIAGGSTEPQKS